MSGYDARKANYQAWEVAEESYPTDGDLEEKIRFLINYGILAPSTHNTQPWIFDIKENTLKVSANPALSLPFADPSGSNMQISLGCFVANVERAAKHFGLEVTRTWSKEEIILKFYLPGEKQTVYAGLDAITDRFSDKRPYQSIPLKKEDKRRMEEVASPKGHSLVIIEERKRLEKIAGLQQTAIIGYSSNKGFFKELSSWLRPSNTKAFDGMPGFVVGLSNLQSKIFRKIIGKGKPSAIKVLAKKERESILTSSAAAFIVSEKDTPESWFETGLYYENLALAATENGIAMAPMAAIIECRAQREEVKDILGITGRPQFFFRIGYSKHKPFHTPRKSEGELKTMETQKQIANIVDAKIQFKQARIGKYGISYIVAGEGEPLLLLHGANIGWAQWYQNISALAKRFKVYALDLPGAGNSTTVNFHQTDFEKDYVEVVDKFIATNKLDKLHIVGSSFGGWIALKLAIDKKTYIRKIVLSNPLGFTSHMPLRFRPVSLRPFALFLSKTALRADRKNKNLEKFMRDVFYDKNLQLAPEFIEYFYELSRKSHNVLFISRLAHFSGMRKELFLEDDLKEITNPVCVIWGKEDPLMPFESVKDNFNLIPGVQVKNLEKVGHMPPVESPDIFNKLTIEFLEE